MLALLLIAGHLLGCVALAATLEGIALALSVCGMLLSAVRTIGDALLRWADSAREIELRDGRDGAWLDAHGGWHEATVAAGAYASPWLIVVPFAGGSWKRKWVVIAPDAASRDDRRRLRVWLRWRTYGIDGGAK